MTYTFLVRNTGTVTLTAVGVTDDQIAPAGALSTDPTCGSLAGPAGACAGATTSLAPGQTATFTASYTVTQADLDHGSLGDSATASGLSPSGAIVISLPSTLNIAATTSAAVTVVKSSTTTSITTVGQVVTYTFVATNTGNVTLANVGITDAQIAPASALTAAPTCQSLAAPAGSCAGSTATLAPGQSATFTATATVAQGDLDNGSLNDAATATGTPPSGSTVTSAPSSVSIPAATSPASDRDEGGVGLERRHRRSRT